MQRSLFAIGLTALLAASGCSRLLTPHSDEQSAPSHDEPAAPVVSDCSECEAMLSLVQTDRRALEASLAEANAAHDKAIADLAAASKQLGTAEANAVALEQSLATEKGARTELQAALESAEKARAAAQAKVAELQLQLAARPETPATTEDDHWDSLAALVESGRVGDTDVVLKIVDSLKADGLLTDTARVDRYRPREGRKAIDESNAAGVAAVLRGE